MGIVWENSVANLGIKVLSMYVPTSLHPEVPITYKHEVLVQTNKGTY